MVAVALCDHFRPLRRRQEAPFCTAIAMLRRAVSSTPGISPETGKERPPLPPDL